MSWDGEWVGAVVKVQEQCAVDWTCLWENIGSPAVWGPLVYGALVTLGVFTPTQDDSSIGARAKHLGLKVKDLVNNCAEMVGKKPDYLGKPKDPPP